MRTVLALVTPLGRLLVAQHWSARRGRLLGEAEGAGFEPACPCGRRFSRLIGVVRLSTCKSVSVPVSRKYGTRVVRVSPSKSL
jgi:hypothetical protein